MMMAGKSQSKIDRKSYIFAVLAAFFCIGTAALFSGMAASAEIPWGEKVLRQQSDIGFKRGATVYQRITAGGYTVTLADEIPGISLRLTITMEDGTEYFHDWIKGQDYLSAGEICLDFAAFDNLLGAKGFSLGLRPWGWMYERGYYMVTEGKPVLIADSWDSYQSGDDYVRDIDGDGENELLCNVVWGDGACRGLVYDYADGQIFVGAMEDLLDEPYDDWGVASFGCQFWEEENVVRIWYWKDELDDYEEKQYAVDLDKIEMEPYEPSFRVPLCFEWEE